MPQGWNDYVTGISLIADSVKTLGVTATVDTPDQDTWWAAKSDGDFQAILHWTDTGATPYDLYSDIMDGRWLVAEGEAADFNFGRYDSPEATAALAAYADATSTTHARSRPRDASRSSSSTTSRRCRSARVRSSARYNTRNYAGWPSEDDPYAPADPTQPTAVYILTQLKPAS